MSVQQTELEPTQVTLNDLNHATQIETGEDRIDRRDKERRGHARKRRHEDAPHRIIEDRHSVVDDDDNDECRQQSAEPAQRHVAQAEQIQTQKEQDAGSCQHRQVRVPERRASSEFLRLFLAGRARERAHNREQSRNNEDHSDLERIPAYTPVGFSRVNRNTEYDREQAIEQTRLRMPLAKPK